MDGYLKPIDEVYGIHKIHIHNAASLLIEVQLLYTLQGQPTRKGPIRNEQHNGRSRTREILKLLIAYNLGELIPSHMSDNAHDI